MDRVNLDTVLKVFSTTVLLQNPRVRVVKKTDKNVVKVSEQNGKVTRRED